MPMHYNINKNLWITSRNEIYFVKQADTFHNYYKFLSIRYSHDNLITFKLAKEQFLL